MASSRSLLSASRHLRTNASRPFSSLAECVANPAKRVQSYISTTNDPYLNLSIEHYLLQKSSPDSTILFIYVNRPCVVIGRNQNPWYEVNLGILQATEGRVGKETEPPGIGNVDLVRRRSGGGTVFHDEGNVNWSVIYPPQDFTRDKHAEMIVRALRHRGIARARVNERHDIVLDQGRDGSASPAPEDTHVTPFTAPPESGVRPLKVSGSAYKLTRTRALHHGTCLLQSPNLHIIPQYLHSPVRPFIKARGVESVSSPVANIGLEVDDFKKIVQQEFATMHNHPEVDVLAVGQEQLDNPDIRQGYNELKTLDWIFAQTPQFTLSNRPVQVNTDVSVEGPALADGGDAVTVSVKNGVVVDVGVGSTASSSLKDEAAAVPRVKLQELANHLGNDGLKKDGLASWIISSLSTKA